MENVVEQENPITDAEWEVMRIVWTLGAAHSSKIITELQADSAWTESTIKTLLRRLVKKGLLRTKQDGRRYIYIPTVDQTTMLAQAARQFLDKVCDMHKGQVLLQLLEDSPVSQKDLAAMRTVIDEKAQTAPVSVPCNCLQKGEHFC